ncbi:hypothetical protein TNIN_403541 [Trichonephila inaurata madagascariensis]|uniref:Uncharacterized protein n=1 Tax=Trichonephila inaurata madagascariensis TaxID=2747483 RepID=A0A8X6XC83_9ARAC|nr:hypothetical protein TNIN_403541 [Trichonephila inaurata madagascariensis]
MHRKESKLKENSLAELKEMSPYAKKAEDVRGPRAEGQRCSTAGSNSFASNTTQRRRSNDYYPCSRIILFVEDVPSFGSACYFRSKYQSNKYFLKEKQANSSGTLDCHFLAVHDVKLEG